MTKGIFTLQYLLKILVKICVCLESGSTVGTQVLCLRVLVQHWSGYPIARFGIQTGLCSGFSGTVSHFVCNWLWMALVIFLLSFDKRIVFYLFFPVDFECRIRNASEIIRNGVKCNFNVKLISSHVFLFSSTAALSFDFEVIINSKFILHSGFRKRARLIVYRELQIPTYELTIQCLLIACLCWLRETYRFWKE